MFCLLERIFFLSFLFFASLFLRLLVLYFNGTIMFPLCIFYQLLLTTKFNYNHFKWIFKKKSVPVYEVSCFFFNFFKLARSTHLCEKFELIRRYLVHWDRQGYEECKSFLFSHYPRNSIERHRKEIHFPFARRNI